MAKKSAKAKGPRTKLAKLPARPATEWKRISVFKPKNAPPDIVEEFAFPAASSQQRRLACTRKVGGKGGKPSKVLRDCHVELVFDQGMFLRFCTVAGEPGPRVPVKTQAEATKLSRQFCACRTSGTDAATCATQVAPTSLQGAPKRKRK